jgi:RNA-directed DNA polymerase
LGNLSTPDSIQKLQTALHAKAKAEPGYRFYALYDKISREDILAHAYAQCRSTDIPDPRALLFPTMAEKRLARILADVSAPSRNDCANRTSGADRRAKKGS